MKWEKCDSNDGYYRMNVEASWSELSGDYDSILSKYAKSPVAGFRSGKAPLNLIEKHFQKEILNDLSHRSIQRFGRKAVLESGVEIYGQVEAEDIECSKGMDFRARLRFHLMPEFDLPDINNLIPDNDGADPRDQISMRLLELVSFDIPDQLVKDEIELDGIGEAEPGDEPWEPAANRIKLMLILKQIARQEGIEVEEAEVKKRIAEKAKEFGIPERTLVNQLEKEDGLQRLRDILIAESTFDYLLEKNS